MAQTEVLPPREAQALVALDEAKRQIQLARDQADVAALLEWRDRAAAIAHYAHRRGEAREIADDAGEVKIRAEAAIGQIDGIQNPEGRPKKAIATVDFPTPDVGPNTRRDWRNLGKLEPGQLDALVEQLRADESGGVTTTRAARLAREISPSKRRVLAPERHERRQLVETYHERLREAARELRWLEANADRAQPPIRQLAQWDEWLKAIVDLAQTARSRLDQ